VADVYPLKEFTGILLDMAENNLRQVLKADGWKLPSDILPRNPGPLQVVRVTHRGF
jgi:hypothetical protein